MVDIQFFCLTVLFPIVLIFLEGFKAPNTKSGTIFKITFSVLSTGLVVWIVLNKTLLKNYKAKLLAKQVALEHDYAIENGNTEKIKVLWHRNEKVLTMFSLVHVVLTGGLIAILLIGAAKAFMQIGNMVTIIIGMYTIAYLIKFLSLIIKGEDEYDE